jgi:hypothetical protein
VYRVKDN